MDIYSIGEMVIDFILGEREGEYIRNAGGAAVNVAIAAARNGLETGMCCWRNRRCRCVGSASEWPYICQCAGGDQKYCSRCDRGCLCVNGYCTQQWNF